MIPGEFRVREGSLAINAGKAEAVITVVNIGDRPIQVGSHYHFFEVNRGLRFDREKAYGMRLNIPAGTAVRFEPGEEKEIVLVELGGERLSFGLNGLSAGSVRRGKLPEPVRIRLAEWEDGI
ncbi:urease subunit beta [Paenibacillus validus]|uniref:urease subunit beta n=1 Tax=Paenibacillus TaxID=44249 RepID=UPI000FD80F4A|nr:MULTISPECIES: urease subunit beta [Paenibacillus]MED4603353.1 urease subunit beta [Paenibacillus validus]MED4607944.1 urease subunit beta [Paenibacillus validus]